MISLKILNFGWLWSQICLLTPGLCTTSDVTATNMNCALVSRVCDYRLCRCGILERRDSVLSLLPVCFNSSTPMLVLMPGIFLNGDARNSGEDCIGDITVGPNGVMVMNKTSLYKLHMTKFHHSVSPQLSQLLRFRYGFMSFGQVVPDLIVFFCLIQISTDIDLQANAIICCRGTRTNLTFWPCC